MLSTARQACTRLTAPNAASSLISQALPAESSRQAVLRATAAAAAAGRARQIHSQSSSIRASHSQQHASGRGRRSRRISSGVTYSAALALAEVEDERPRHPLGSSRFEGYSEDVHRDPTRITSPTPTPTPKPPDRRDQSDNRQQQEEEQFVLDPTAKRGKAWLDSWLHTYDIASLPPSPLPPLETFRGLLSSQPLLALLTLPTLSQVDLGSLRHFDVKTLVHRVLRAVSDNPSILRRLNTEDAARSLRILRALLYALPTSEHDTDAFMGRCFRGRLLRSFLHLCVRLGVPRLAKAVFQKRLRDQMDSGEVLHLDADGIVRDMAAMKQWKLIVDLFSPETFPHQYYTAEVLSIYMQALFGVHQGSRVPKTFEMYHKLDIAPTADALSHLIQAYLELGDLPTARAIVKEANISGVSNHGTQQLAILRGYRSLGLDEDLEKHVLSDIQRLQLPLEARLLNALIRLRLDAGDYDAAGDLLSRFDFDEPIISENGENGTQGGVKPTDSTVRLAITLVSKTGRKDQLKTIWENISDRSELMTDEMISTVVRAMADLRMLPAAFDMLSASAGRTAVNKTADVTWRLPSGIKPGRQTLNFLLGQLSAKEGVAGFEKGLELMQALHVKPDTLTLKIIVDFARSHFQHDPNDLALLVNRITKLSKIQPSQSILDSILADAVAAAARAQSRSQSTTKASPNLLPSLSEDTMSLTAGMRTTPKLRSAIVRIIQSLESRDSQSTSRSLANRMRYDAMTSRMLGVTPSARLVWNALIARGFKPDQRHFVALMQGYADIGHMHSAQDLLILAEQVGVPISRPMLFTLLVGWGKQQRAKTATRIYERIRSLPEGLDQTTVTAMIQALSYAGWRAEAARLVRTDLETLDVKLDKKAVIVAAQALRANGNAEEALDILQEHFGETLGSGLGARGRKLVKSILNHLTKVRNENDSLGLLPPAEGARVEDLIKKAEEMLEQDDKAMKRDGGGGKGRRWARLDGGMRSKLVHAMYPHLSRSGPQKAVEKEPEMDKEKEKNKEMMMGKDEGSHTTPMAVGWKACQARRGRRRVVRRVRG